VAKPHESDETEEERRAKIAEWNRELATRRDNSKNDGGGAEEEK